MVTISKIAVARVSIDIGKISLKHVFILGKAVKLLPKVVFLNAR